MKFFTNLPKTSFETTIGSFNISNFFTYLNVKNIFINKTEIVIDNKTTLIEASYQAFNNVNNIWSFLAANNTINPFNLLPENNVVFQNNNSDKINFLLFPEAGMCIGGIAFLEGSIITPYVGNTGGPGSYGSTGNFNINGPFARIEKSSFYDGNMVLGLQYGGTGDFITLGSTTDLVTVLSINEGGTYSWGGTYYTSTKQKYTKAVVYIENTEEGQSIFRSPNVAYYTVDDVMVAEGYDPNNRAAFSAANSEQFTTEQIVESTTKTIKSYVTGELGNVRSSFITAKYN